MAKKIDQAQVRKVAKYIAYRAFLVLFIFPISSCFISEGNSANQQDSDKVRVENDGIERVKKSDLRRLTTEHILTDTNIFNDLYFLHCQKRLSIYGKEVELELYSKKHREDIGPYSIIVVKSDNNEFKLPIDKPFDKIHYIIPKSEKPILCLWNLGGGNAWNANPMCVISLEEKHFLKNLGQISSVYDVDNDGIDELIIYEDIWEGGLRLLGHSSAPGVRIILRIKKDRIVPDISNNIYYYQNEIKRINTRMKMIPKEVSGPNYSDLLSLILEKFLIYRLLGNVEKGWDEFNKDIRHYDDNWFYFVQRKIPIEEIENRMSESLRDEQK